MAPAPSDMLCFALHSAAHAVHSAYAPLLHPLGLTYPQYLVLATLAAADGQNVGQTVGQIGAELRLESNTLTPLLQRMERSGWVSRTRGTQDERVVRITLTDAGRVLADSAAHIPLAFAEKTKLTPPDIADLRDVLQVIRDRLKPAPRR